MQNSLSISFHGPHTLLLLLVLLPWVRGAVGQEGFCSVPPSAVAESSSKPLYWKVTNPTLSPANLQDLPGFTRSVYRWDHALITPESHVFSPLPDWVNTLGAYLITPAMGAHFSMYLAKMQENSRSGLPPKDVERFVFVVDGSVTFSNGSIIDYKLPLKTNESHECACKITPRCESRCDPVASVDNKQGDQLQFFSYDNIRFKEVDSYAYLPPNVEHLLKCDTTATIIIFERRYISLENHCPEQIIGSTEKQPLLDTPGEVFELRKLLPTSAPYDFNIHIMDFQPGEYLNVKEVHYNQHGLLLLEGQGIYRLGDSWYPVQAGDVIWMAPFVPQWYAALGKTRSRYLLYKDVNRNLL